MLTERIAAIGRAPWSSLDTLARAVWQDLAAGRVTEAEADAIVTAIEERRRAARRPVSDLSVPKVVVVREGAARSPATNVAAWPAARSSPRQLRLTIPSPARY